MLRQWRLEQCFSLFVTTLLCHLTAALSRPASLTQDIPLLQVNVTTLNVSGGWVEVRLFTGRHSAVFCTSLNLQEIVLYQRGVGRHEHERVIYVICTPCDYLQVSWSGIQSPSIRDAVALVVPADVDYRETAPAKHKWASESPAHLDTGSGSLK